jgi:hypothetical protein
MSQSQRPISPFVVVIAANLFAGCGSGSGLPPSNQVTVLVTPSQRRHRCQPVGSGT